MANIDETYMKRALNLAKLGKGKVAPNPMVGSVIVCDGKIIGEGYHQKCGEAHAEVNAINSVKNKSLLSQSTIYVNLEPCAHFGKTPPCSNLIIESNIPRVVIGCVDSYAKVAGKGIEKMKKAGINVKVGVLEQEALNLNRRFFTFHSKKRPYVILKWAQSVNGFMDIKRSKNNDKGIFWITQPETKTLVHKWRAEEAGILVGRNTIEVDNPSLTCRAYDGKHPVRIVLDKDLKADYLNKNITTQEATTFIFNQKKSEQINTTCFIKINEFSLESILFELYQREVQSIIIEGGKYTLEQFIKSNLWDEARVLTGTSNILKGIKAPILHQPVINSYYFGKDKVEILLNI
jgi:diaminohydroxyphosphoribosylaminopyrimidine deaminase/5-amino-6-(5-phosphoribosylamino)uracil reductase